MTDYRRVEVHDHSISAKVGELVVARTRGRENYTFTYSREFLDSPDGYAIDPTLPRSATTTVTTVLPGALTDTSPDRWGRRIVARAMGGHLHESDYLFSVHDELRQGALRFREHGEWVGTAGVTPKVIDLPALAGMMRSVKDDSIGVHEAAKELLEVGSSALGGAHPKASVRSEDGALYIAKLALEPSDELALGREFATLNAMRSCGIDVEGTPRMVGSTALLIPRFDRGAQGIRVPYMSIKSALSAAEGERFDYADVATVVDTEGTRGTAELWKRVAFGALVHNTDDHLRNHGLIRRNGSWALSPVFDVNPDLNDRTEHATSLFGATSAEDMSATLAEAADLFGVSRDDARQFVNSANRAVRDSRLPDTVKARSERLLSVVAKTYRVHAARSSVKGAMRTPANECGAPTRKGTPCMRRGKCPHH